MKKTIRKFALLSGLLATLLMICMVIFLKKLGYDQSMLVGYAAILISLSMIFFGVRAYRDKECGGTISFGKAFGAGLIICLVSSVFYVITWEIIYFNFMPDFCEHFARHSVEELKASGASQATIDATMKEIEEMKVMLDNPIMNTLMTFLEPLPVGLVIALVSALILKRKPHTMAQA